MSGYQRDQYEYDEITIVSGIFPGQGTISFMSSLYTGSCISEVLNPYGEQGWEAWAIERGLGPSPTGVKVYLRRRRDRAVTRSAGAAA